MEQHAFPVWADDALKSHNPVALQWDRASRDLTRLAQGRIRQYGLSGVLAEDLAQQALLEVWAKIEDFDNAQHAARYACLVIRSRAMNTLRNDEEALTDEVSGSLACPEPSEEVKEASEIVKRIASVLGISPDGMSETLKSGSKIQRQALRRKARAVKI